MTINEVAYFHSIQLTKKTGKTGHFCPDFKSGSGIPDIGNPGSQKSLVGNIYRRFRHKTVKKFKFLLIYI